MTNLPVPGPGHAPALISLLERQRRLYLQLRTLSDQQGPLVAEAEPEPLLGLLSQRQKLIDDLSVVNTDIEPYRQRWDDLWAELAESDRARVGGLVKEVQGLLEAIINQDERDRHVLQNAKTRVAGELRTLGRAGQAINADRTAPRAAAPTGIGTGNNRFTNQKG
jgi:hypothetical protein